MQTHTKHTKKINQKTTTKISQNQQKNAKKITPQNVKKWCKLWKFYVFLGIAMEIWGASFRGAPLRTQKTLKKRSENASKIDLKNIQIYLKNAFFCKCSRDLFDACLLFVCYLFVVLLTFF